MHNRKYEENQLRRMLGLARYMEREAPGYSVDPDDAFVTGFFGGIGHSPEKTESGTQDCGILRDTGAHLSDLAIAKNLTPAEYMRIHRCTAKKIPGELLLLWKAELSVGEDGREIGPVMRLRELKDIHGEESRPYQCALETAEWLARQKDRRTGRILLVIDLQDAFRKAEYSDKVAQFVRLARPNYDLVCGTVFCNPEETDPGYREALGWDGCSGTEEELKKTVCCEPDILFVKHGYGMPEEMLEWLDPKAEYDVTGCDSDACVLAVCFQLWDRGIRFHILSEYIYTGFASGFTHDNVEMIMQKNFGDRFCRNTAELFEKRGWPL